MKTTNKLKYILPLALTLTASHVLAKSGPKIEDNIKKLNWNGIEVVYIEDNRFPTYDMTIYFADGALSDGPKELGLSDHSFGHTDSGTEKLSQKEILEMLEFTGTRFSTDVTHEYSTIAISGLSKDLNSSMTQICSLLRETNYPEKVIKKELAQQKTGLQSLIASPQGLAERVFREVSLGGTPYAYPVGGKIKDFQSYNSTALRKKMDYFLNDVKKRIYLTGPKSILGVEKVLNETCQFSAKPTDFVRVVDKPWKRKAAGSFIFVPLPDANQVQVRVGRYLNTEEANERVLDALAADFLGGGFTSKLMREIRVKRGLSYGVSAYISSQKQYGRAGISTFTKNETIDKLITVIDQTIADIAHDGIKQDELNLSLEGMVGGYPFRFESNTAFLAQLLYLDHTGQPYSELFDFKDAVKKYGPVDVSRKIKEVFSIDKQVILVLGDRKILPSLKKLEKKYGKLKILSYRPFI